MKKLVYNKITREIDIIDQEQIPLEEYEKDEIIIKFEVKTENIDEQTKDNVSKEKNKTLKIIKECLEKNKIFAEIFSLAVLGIINLVLSFSNAHVNGKIMEIYEKQLELQEYDKSPHFSLVSKNIREKVEVTEGTDKIAICRYTITNNGGDITNVSMWVESYIFFCIPTSVKDEWYIFKYWTSDFDVNHRSPKIWEEKDKRVAFYEYASEMNENESIDRQFALGNYLSESLNKRITHEARNYVCIEYTDYTGERQTKIFEFDRTGMWELDEEPKGISVGVSLDATNTDLKTGEVTLPIDINDYQAVGNAIKKEIEDWLEKNEGSKGYKKPSYMW